VTDHKTDTDLWRQRAVASVTGAGTPAWEDAEVRHVPGSHTGHGRPNDNGGGPGDGSALVACATCGAILDGDPDEDPTGDAGGTDLRRVRARSELRRRPSDHGRGGSAVTRAMFRDAPGSGSGSSRAGATRSPCARSSSTVVQHCSSELEHGRQREELARVPFVDSSRRAPMDLAGAARRALPGRSGGRRAAQLTAR
jgi:hypothetical protein